MSLTTLLTGERRSSLEGTRPLTAASLLDILGGAPSATGKRVSEEGSLRLGVVYTCTLIISDGVASLPLPVYKRLGDREKERAVDHPAYPLLNRRPNPWMNAYTLRQTLQGHLCLWGNAFAEIMRDGNGQLTGLFPLRPDRMQRPILAASGDLLYPYQLPSGEGVLLPSSRVLHLRGLSSDGLWGYSPVALQREAIALGLTMEEMAGRLFNNMASPSGVLRVKGKLSDEGATRLAQSWQARHGGLENAHRVAVLEEGVEWQAIGMPMDDAQFLESRQFERSEIAGWFRVPPHMIGDTEKSTSWGCLPGDTLIFTTRGPKPIRDVVAGDRVWSLGEGSFTQGVVQAQWMTGVKPVRVLKTTARTLRLTDNHRLLVRRKHPKPQPGQGGYRKVEWRDEWIAADQVQLGDLLVVARQMPESDGRVAPNGRALTVGFMELCGLLIGDGGVTNWGLTFARHKDAPYMDHYRESLRAEFHRAAQGGTFAAVNRPRRPITLREYDRATSFSSVSAAEEMRALGFSGTAKTKRVPPWIFELSHDLQLAFLRGYLDADGACNERGWITYSSVNHDLLEDVRHLCMQVGVPAGRVTAYRTTGSGLIAGRHVNREFEMHQLYLCDQVENRRIGSNHPRDAARLEVVKPPQRVGRNHPNYQGRGGSPESRPGTYFNIDGASLQVVKSIEFSPVHQPVYDLSVTGTHSFIADGVLVHNSGIESQTLGFITFTLRPWLVNWEQELSINLLTEPEQRAHFIEHLIEGLLRGDTAARQAFYTAMADRGVLSINDIRALENMNPVDGGDERFIQANMVPLSMAGEQFQKTDPAADALPQDEPPDDQQQNALSGPIETRSIDRRASLREVYRPLFEDAARRVVEREAAAIREHGLDRLEQHTAEGFTSWLGQFYRDDLSGFITRVMTPLMRAYGAATEREVLAELGLDSLSESPAPFLEAYVESMAKTYTGRSQGQMQQLLRKALEEQLDAKELVEERLTEWLDTRPEKIADIESVRAGEAVAHKTYRRAGVRRLKWHLGGGRKHCAYCARLNGKTVGIEESFLNDGNELEGNAGDPPMKIRGKRQHPPAHAACRCFVSAAK